MQTGACTSVCTRSNYLPIELPRPIGATNQSPDSVHPLERLGVRLSVTPRAGALPLRHIYLTPMPNC